MLRRLLLILCASLLLPALAEARTNAIQPELVAEGPAVAGGEVELAIHMRTSPGWHGYWLNPGDAGLPMTVDWRLPRGFSIGPLRYPVPSRLEVAGLMNYVYESDYALLTRLKVPSGARGVIPVRAEARWLACTDKICVPEQGQLSLDLPIGNGSPNRTLFDGWRSRLPRPLTTPGSFQASNGRLHIAIPLPSDLELGKPYLFPAADGVIDYEAPQIFRRSGDRVVAELALKGAEPSQFAGVLSTSDGRGFEFRAVPGPVPAGGHEIGGLGPEAVLWAVLGAIAGGLLLNLMPCVFPVLAMKAVHVAKAAEGKFEARRDALAYGAGAIIGTAALGGVLLLIRAAGAEAGWAFQLQDPRTIMLLLLLATAITANLLGLFELPTLAGNARPAGSFGTGALAAFVATPCAGPFLGAALGTALLLPAIGSIAVFAALGLGLAAPFILIAFVPAIRRRLPRPGPWMKRLQRFLAIPMAATVAACLWLLDRQTGERGLVLGIVAAGAVAILLLGYGLVRGRSIGSGWLAGPLLLAVAGLALWQVPARQQELRAIAGAEPWSTAKIASYSARGEIMFVYFTADWCLTCKANEAAAINRPEVRKAFSEAGVKVLAGDWTNGDPEITRFLDGRGRAGVPLYLWYAPGKVPEELPQVLTANMLISRARSAR